MEYPENALNLTDGLIIALTRITRDAEVWVANGMNNLYKGEIVESFNSVKEEIDELGYSWFEIDPIEFSCELIEKKGKYFYTFFYRDDKSKRIYKNVEFLPDLGKLLFKIKRQDVEKIQEWIAFCDKTILDLNKFKKRLALSIDIKRKIEKKAESTSVKSGAQKKEADEFEYLCKDKIHILGFVAEKKGNIIRLNGKDIPMGDSLLLPFLRLALELKKNKGGWASIKALDEEGILVDIYRHNIFNKLRTLLKPALLEGDALKFIQNDGFKNYRISVSPDFITYDRNNLRNHPEGRILKTAFAESSEGKILKTTLVEHPERKIREIAKKLPKSGHISGTNT